MDPARRCDGVALGSKCFGRMCLLGYCPIFCCGQFASLKSSSMTARYTTPLRVCNFGICTYFQDTKLEVLQALTDARREVGILARPILKFVRLISY